MNQKREYPWSTLEIDKTDDKKAIKKAYAVLIKHYKPDEHPEEFQEIQEAYKHALLLIYDINKALTNIEDSQCLNAQENSADELPTEENNIVVMLLKELKVMTFTKIKDKNNLKNWSFLEEFYSLENLTLKDKVAKEVFKKVAENNLFLLKIYNSLLISPKVLMYMNEIFDWTSKWNEYGKIFPQEYFIVTLDYIENGIDYSLLVENFLDNFRVNIDKTSQSIIDTIEVPIKRFWSLILDSLFSLIILLNIDTFEVVKNNMNAFYLLIFFGMRLIIELLTIKGLSFGKFFMRLKIMNNHSNYLTKKQLFIRHLIIFSYFIPLITASIVSSTYDNLLLIIFCAIASINLINFLIKKRFFHDILSNTRIVKI